MKQIVLLFACACFCVSSTFLLAEEASEKSEFPGLKKTMSAADYKAAGLQKLTADQRAALDDFVRGYLSSGKKRIKEQATTEAVERAAKEPQPEPSDRAVKESKPEASDVIQSRIVGPFAGYNGHTTFTLENGQKWTQSQPESANFKKIDSPPVLIVKGQDGYRMYIAGGGDIHVEQVK